MTDEPIRPADYGVELIDPDSPELGWRMTADSKHNDEQED